MECCYYMQNGILKPFSLMVKPLGKGGQACVYRVELPVSLEDCCVKIYHKGCSDDMIERLCYMINNPPKILKTSAYRICWPIGLVYNKSKEVLGFYMNTAFPNSRDLYILSFYTKGKTIADRFKKDVDWFDKYERNTGEGIMNRLKMIANISQAFYQIHHSRCYVALDIKPMNILATSTGKISIVDTDSFQIAESEKILFPGVAATPEYCAPEFDEQFMQNRPFTISNDLFSLPVMFYQIIMGVHPFTGVRLLPPYDTEEYSELKPIIHRSLFVYGCNKRYVEKLDPNPHAFFERMPKSLQLMFIKAFDAPNYRPTMEEWCKELFKLISR